MSPEVIGRLAQQYSTCGSAQKTPDASFKMLRGRPGELTFKRGEMAKEFENVAFSAPVGSLSVVDTQFGSHLIYINARDDADPKGGRGKKSKKQKGFGVRGGFIAPTTRTRPSSRLAASKLPPLVEKLQLLVPLGFVAQISFLVASNQISGPENLASTPHRHGVPEDEHRLFGPARRGHAYPIGGPQIWWERARDLEAGRPVKPPITSPYPKYRCSRGEFFFVAQNSAASEVAKGGRKLYDSTSRFIRAWSGNGRRAERERKGRKRLASASRGGGGRRAAARRRRRSPHQWGP